MTRYTVIGLENNAKRTLIWLDGELTGDDDLQQRFRQRWDEFKNQQLYAEFADKRPRVFARLMTERVMESLFEETLDLRRDSVRTDEELQAWADEWNNLDDGDEHHYTVEDMRGVEEERNFARHNGPPYGWDEIARCLKRPPKPYGEKPDYSEKCIECLQPMEWIWFRSSTWTWKHLCGRAGWTPICRSCKTWRACHTSVMN